MFERRIQIPTSLAEVTIGLFDRKAIEAAIEFLIDLLDAQDGDPDVEFNGDEQDGDRSEDDFMRHRGKGPGCLISDGDSAVDDRPCDAADSGDDEEDFREAWAPVYGVDQTHMLPHTYGAGRELVPDFPCADVIAGPPT